MYKFSDIKILQIEISNHCNAACPQCPRNVFGGKTIPTLPLKTWNMTEFKNLFSIDLLKELSQVYFCGTYGDPLTNKHIVHMCKFLKENNPNIEIGIHTNGGIGKTSTYSELAQYTDFIAFGIDGIKNTNHIYRRNVKWNKLMANTAAYINAGGKAIWDFIVFDHNQHQVEIARELSKSLGFTDFFVKCTSRFLNREHKYKDVLPVYNKQGFLDYTINIPTDKKYVNKNYEILNQVQSQHSSLEKYANTTCIKCNADRIKEIYIGADGYVFPCGWLHDRMYGVEVESHSDYIKIRELITQAGGITKTNIFYNSLENIVNGSWFNIISDSWTNQNRLERCGIMCGETLNLIMSQNDEINYKK